MKRTLLVSLVLHAVAIALLLTIHASEPPRVSFARVTAIASPYRAPPPVKSHLPLKFDQRVPPVRPLHTVARTFHVPERSAQLAPPELTPVLAAPPSIALSSIAPPLIQAAPNISDTPPAPVRRPVSLARAFDATIPSSIPANTPSNQAAAHTAITTGAFGNASIAAAVARPGQKAPPTVLSPAEILSKPRPAYTEEARRLQIEGEVLLEVLFGASGEARVLRMIRGLGHGLDENANSAAREIRFRPAQRDGEAIDSTAVVHIVFQLAH